MNGDAGVAKLSGGDRGARRYGVFFDVSAQDLFYDQPPDIHFAAFKLRDSQLQKFERLSLLLAEIVERTGLAQDRQHLFLNFFHVTRRVPPTMRDAARLQDAVAENAEVAG